MLLFLALFVGIFAYFFVGGTRTVQQGFEEKSAAAAQVVASNAYWIAQVANQTLRRVDAALGADLTGNAGQLRPALEGLPGVTEVYIVDADAKTIYSTVPGAQDVSVADRDYFTALKAGAPFYTSSLIVSRLTSDRIFVFSKSILRDGQFAGAIMVSLPESLMADIFATLDLDEGSTVSLVRDDGQLIARYPSAPEGGIDLSDLPLFTEYLPASPVGSYYSASSPVDGIPRVVSYRRVPDTDIVALASVASEAGWANFNTALLTVVLIASPIILGLCLASWWIIRLHQRDAHQAEVLQAQAGELNKLVELNTLLFREIHHRVKNNLQSVQALVRMQELPDAVKRDLQSRLAAMAAMHEHIYQHDRYVDIDAHAFVPAVVDEVKIAYGSPIDIQYEVDHVTVSRDHASPLALLLSELVTNTFKYAFPTSEFGTVLIRLEGRQEGRAYLTVRDNGVGMPEGAGDRRSMGMRLVQGIVAQMEGTYSFRNDGGTVFEADIVLSIPAGAQK